MKSPGGPTTVPGLCADEIALIKKIIGDQYSITIFGSRATGQHRRFSDVDICLKGNAKIPDEVMAALRFAFQDSNLPYVVDLVDEATLSDAFKVLIANGLRI